MPKKIAIFLTHGMGDITQDEFKEKVKAIRLFIKKARRTKQHFNKPFLRIFALKCSYDF